MSDSIITTQLYALKEKLLDNEKEYNECLDYLAEQNKTYKECDTLISKLLEGNADQEIRINFGGKRIETYLETILSAKDSLFYKLIYDDLIAGREITKDFFFEIDFQNVDLIMNYLRTGLFLIKNTSTREIQRLKEDLLFFGLWEPLEKVNKMLESVQFIKFESGPRHGSNGTHNVKDLHEKSGSKGICVSSPYFITIEFNMEHTFSEIEVMGYRGNTGWAPNNGANATIQTSMDGKSFVNVGKLPGQIENLVKVKLTKSTAKFIKFNHTGYLGLGYLNIIKE